MPITPAPVCFHTRIRTNTKRQHAAHQKNSYMFLVYNCIFSLIPSWCISSFQCIIFILSFHPLATYMFHAFNIQQNALSHLHHGYFVFSIGFYVNHFPHCHYHHHHHHHSSPLSCIVIGSVPCFSGSSSSSALACSCRLALSALLC